jgi:phosphoribosyl 1,2-cyclic phosphodiesterase
MKIRFWGVRGSIPAPGPDTIRYGGNTACVSVHTRAGGLVIIDMGTGLMHLGNALVSGAFGAFGTGGGRATILLSHTHWDHIQGLGFFAPVFVAGNAFTVWGPGGSPEVLEAILEGQMDPNFSPLQTLKNFSAAFDVKAITLDAPFDAEGLTVTAREHAHGASTALAFRLVEDGRTFVYASDVGQPSDAGPDPDAIAFYRDADVLLHDSTYRPSDQATRRNRGFSSYDDAAAAAVAARARRLVTFHYDQDYSDDDVDELVASCRKALDARGGAAIGLQPAREGDELEI